MCIALLRGINVGKARRIPMRDLRALVAGLGHGDARTLLNSGNVVFSAARSGTGRLARELEAAIATRFGFAVKVAVITSAELAAVIDENPLQDRLDRPSQFLVAFTTRPATLAKVSALAQQTWGEDQLAMGPRAAYMACSTGILASPLVRAFVRVTGDAATTRNWSTVLKLRDLAARQPAPSA
jgi:uncharacterized protein (DUF1697 family)